MVRGGGLEPPHLSAYAPQTYVSTIPPPAQAVLSDLDEIHGRRQSRDAKVLDNAWAFSIRTRRFKKSLTQTAATDVSFYEGQDAREVGEHGIYGWRPVSL